VKVKKLLGWVTGGPRYDTLAAWPQRMSPVISRRWPFGLGRELVSQNVYNLRVKLSGR